jgi:hypothetical protein
MEINDQQRYREAVLRLASSSEKWLKVKEYLESEIISLRSVIDEIDKAVKDRELTMTKLQ